MLTSPEGSRSNPNRRRIGRLASYLLAGFTALHTSFIPAANAKTIESINPSFEDTACSARTLIAGKRPQFEGQNGNFTIRGYGTLSDPYNSEFRWAIDRSQNPDEASFDQSRWNMDVTALARLRETPDGPPIFAIKLYMTSLNGTDINETVESTLTPPDSEEGSVCTTGEITFFNGNPYMKIDGKTVVDTEPIL